VSLLARLLVITFIQSFGSTLIERGLYFYSQDRLGFTEAENLGMALGFGVAYVVGAVASHGLARRLSEKRVLGFALVAQFLAQGAMFAHPAAWLVVAMNTLLGTLMGLMWPLVESYIGAGHTPADQAAAVGRFNLAWASSIPLALAAAGPLIGFWSPGLFAAAAALNLASLVLAWRLDRRPAHLPLDHPERPTPAAMVRYRALLTSSRWLMMASYSLMWTLAPLLPLVFANLKVGVGPATAMSGLLDVFRFLTFLGLQVYVGWHSRGWPIVAAMLFLPAGFFMALFGPNVPAVLAGELLFGIGAGAVYYGALYYALVVKNAAVEAGGVHEGIVGGGFVIGPLAGLVGNRLTRVLGGPLAGMLAGMGPVILACSAGAIWFLAKTSGNRLPRDA
jgi:MFS family permease